MASTFGGATVLCAVVAIVIRRAQLEAWRLEDLLLAKAVVYKEWPQLRLSSFIR